jgi:putative sporulation protein YtxC
MASFSIAVSKKNADAFKHVILSEAERAKSRGLDIQVRENDRGGTTHFEMAFASDGPWPASSLPSMVSRFKAHLALAISDAIVDRWEQAFLHKLAARECSGREPVEVEAVIAGAREILDIAMAGGGRTSCRYVLPPEPWHSRENRKTHIASRLLDYLDSNDTLNVEGFVHFRLKDYLEELQEAVEKAADEVAAEEEYQNLLELLSELVDIQAPRLDVVHVYIYPGRIFRVKSPDGEARDRLCSEGIELIGGELAYEDVLVSALVMLAPSKIILHFGRFSDSDSVAKALAQPLKTIFDRRFVLCESCPWCDRLRS